MSKHTTVIIIDDHHLVREALKELLEKQGDYKIIDEYESGTAFLNQLPNLKEIPDIFILDYQMSGKNGIEVLKETTSNYPDYKFLMLTQNIEESIINDAYKHDARGFLNKMCSVDALKSTIDDITKFGYSNITEILRRVRTSTNTKDLKKHSIDLSEKEFSFLELVCNEKEYTYSEMADIMNVSAKTIDKYRANLFGKLDVKSKTGLVLYSHKHKLTKPFIED